MMKSVIEDLKKRFVRCPGFEISEIGLSDALFSIALLLQQDNNNNDLALLFSSLASYSNPGYPLPLLLTADMLEKGIVCRGQPGLSESGTRQLCRLHGIVSTRQKPHAHE